MPERVTIIKGWAARWAKAVLRACKAEAERDRYREALERIAAADPASWQGIAREALRADR